MKIKAAVVREAGKPFVIEEIELEEPRDDEVLIKVVSSGLCHTDLVAQMTYLQNPLPGVFGHEGAGIVEKVGSKVTKVKPGDHVVSTYIWCGVCPACKQARPGWCVDFRRLNFAGRRGDGSTTMKKGDEVIYGSFFGQSTFATHALINERNAVKVTKDVPLEILSPMGCGIQTGAGGVINSLKAEPGSSIVIFGAGSVGLSAIMAAVICGCTTIIAVDIMPERLKLAKAFGATHVINSKETADVVAEIKKLTDSGAKYTMECTGIPAVFRQAVDSLMMGGTCALLGVAPVGVEVHLEMQVVLDGRTIKGVVEGDSLSDIFIPQLIEFYRKGRLPFDKLLTFYTLDQINEAVKDTHDGKALKAILKP